VTRSKFIQAKQGLLLYKSNYIIVQGQLKAIKKASLRVPSKIHKKKNKQRGGYIKVCS